MISVYSDGASGGKQNTPGGYGFVVVKGDEVLLWGIGGSCSTSNNRMELDGCINGLKALYNSDLYIGESVELVSDSQYALGIATGQFHPQKNLELCQELLYIVSKFNYLTCRWVKGHRSSKWNIKCDELAAIGKKENTPSDYSTKKTRRKAKKEKIDV